MAKPSNTAGTTNRFSQEALTRDSRADRSFIITHFNLTELADYFFLNLPHLCLKDGGKFTCDPQTDTLRYGISAITTLFSIKIGRVTKIL